MSIHQTLLAALLLGATAVPAMAEAPFHLANNEIGFVEHGPEYRRVNGQWQRVDAWNGLDSRVPERRPYQQGDISADGNYMFVGGEQGWSLRPHAYEWENGGPIHADTLRHDKPKPSLNMTEEEKRRSGELYTR